jgi:S1-C subfamily serine protease
MKTGLGAIVATVALAAGVAACGGGEDAGPTGPKKLSHKQVIARASDSVFRISGKQAGETVWGSAVLIDERKRLAITASHAVTATDGLVGTLGDQGPVPVEVVGNNPCADLAVVKLDRDLPGMRAVEFGKSRRLENGDVTYVAGYPATASRSRSLTLTTTRGMVTNANVTDVAIGGWLPRFEELFQTDAGTGPGGSGGAVLNEYGELLGLVVLGRSRTEGYANPSHVIQEYVRELMNGSRKNDLELLLEPIRRVPIADMYDAYGHGELGRVVQEIVQERGLTGMFVRWAQDGGPGEQGGIVDWDAIRSINGTEITTFAGTCRIIESQSPRDTVTIRGYHLDPDHPDFAEPFEAKVKLPR